MMMMETENAIDRRKHLVRQLLLTIGEDPEREGLRDTPKRVAKSWEEFFKGYGQDPEKILSTSFEEIGGYNDVVILKDIRLESHCEHHMLPIIGKVHIAYLPDQRVVGISKLARVVEAYGKRLQVQERLTAQIADAIESVLKPQGVMVVVDAKHSCIGLRGIHKPDSSMVTSAVRGKFFDNEVLRMETLNLFR